MKAAYITGYGGPENFVVGDRPAPLIGPYDLLVQVKAASINPVDYKIRQGMLKLIIKYPMPLTLGQDLSGVVTDVGSKVTRFKAGDEIFARLDKSSIGTFAEFAAVRESDAAFKPVNLTFNEAASVPLVGLTCWQVMRDIAGLRPGQKALIHAGSGGIGTFAIQLGKWIGATIATTTSQRNVPLVKRLGADMVIDYTSQQFEVAMQEADFIFDTLGGETLLRSINAVKPGGTVVTISGIPTAHVMREWGQPWWIVWFAAFMNRKNTAAAKARGVTFAYHFMSPSGAQLTAIAKLLDDKIIVPTVDRVFTLDEAKAAMAYVEAGHASGKVIITP
ncbi:MAG: NADP-dependent oxidoreductase [Pseudomonadota bacterium]